MGVFIRKRQGVEYLYLLAGNSQYFLGRRDDLENLNVQNLHKAARIIDKNFDRVLSKYLDDMLGRAGYFSKSERQKYIAGRLKKIGGMIDQASSRAR